MRPTEQDMDDVSSVNIGVLLGFWAKLSLRANGEWSGSGYLVNAAGGIAGIACRCSCGLNVLIRMQQLRQLVVTVKSP